MKICFVVPRYPGGGVLTATLPLCEGAMHQGHGVSLLFMRQDPEATLPELPHDVESLGSGTDVSSVPSQLLHWVEEHRPDAIIFSGSLAAEEVIPYLPPQIRCILAVHDASDVFWKNALRLENGIDAFVAVSQYVANRFQDRLSTTDKLFVIHNALEIPSRTDKTTSKTVRNDDLYFAGGGTLLKGPEDILRLWPVLVGRGFSGRLHWLGKLEPKLKQRIDRLQDSSRVVCHGKVPHSTVYDIAAQSKILLMLSRSEACPMTLIEASLMGCLTVGWDINSGHKELMEGLGMPYFAVYPNFEALADTIFLALEQHESKATDVAARARENYNKERVWSKYEAAINYAISKPQATREFHGQTPRKFRRRSGYYQIIPAFIRRPINQFIFRSRWLSMWLRNKRGV